MTYHTPPHSNSRAGSSERGDEQPYQPRVLLSVLIATHNREKQLQACLDALAAQTQPFRDFEVIVVVDGSIDGTAVMLTGYQAPYTLRVLAQPNSGQARALNRAITEARGEYCLMLDDDIIPAPGLVAAHLRAQREHDGALCLGCLTISLPPNAGWFIRGTGEWWREHYERLGRGREPVPIEDCFTGNLSAPRQALLTAGCFAVNLPRGHDVELGHRLAQSGLPVVYLPDAVARQHYTKNFTQAVADLQREGAGEVELYHRHPEALPGLRLSGYHSATRRAVMLRRLLLAVRPSPRLLGLAGDLLAAWGSRTLLRAWYNLIYSYFFWLGVRRAVGKRGPFRRLAGGTPVLMYHAIAGRGEGAGRYKVPVRTFRLHLALIKWAGFRVISLDTLTRHLHAHSLPPARSVVITLDDCYEDNRTLAYPVLRRYGFPATLFAVTGEIGGANNWDARSELSGRKLMSWGEVRSLAAQGVTFGAHTRRHVELPGLGPDALRDEVAGSKADLEDALARPVSSFAYPYGSTDERCEAAVAAAGFEGACGVRPGLNTVRTPALNLRRVEIKGNMTLWRFALALWLGDTEPALDRPSGD